MQRKNRKMCNSVSPKRARSLRIVVAPGCGSVGQIMRIWDQVEERGLANVSAEKPLFASLLYPTEDLVLVASFG